MPERLSTVTYLRSEETVRRRELVWGVLREPAAPLYNHQALLLGVATRLTRPVERHRLGVVAMAPLDVVLDKTDGLVLQPDVAFVASDRLHIIRGQVWGPPDLAVEVLSRGSVRYDRGEKLSWYGRYGVRECWIVDPLGDSVDVVVFPRPDVSGMRRRFVGRQIVRSSVLPRLRLQARSFFSGQL
jgi:Uma2 family endonuclease